MVARALNEFIARRQRRGLLELTGKLEWDSSYDCNQKQNAHDHTRPSKSLPQIPQNTIQMRQRFVDCGYGRAFVQAVREVVGSFYEQAADAVGWDAVGAAVHAVGRTGDIEGTIESPGFGLSMETASKVVMTTAGTTDALPVGSMGQGSASDRSALHFLTS